MTDGLDVLIWPLAAGVVLAVIHAWLGLHVLSRGVVFVDLALAQIAALGITIATIAGHAAGSEEAYTYGLAFALAGALLFAWLRAHEHALPQEAVIGIVYAVAAALAVIALDRAPQGAESIKQLLIGTLVTVTPGEVSIIASLYVVIGIVHGLFRRQLIAASFGAPSFRWDAVFYATFAIVVTSSVRIAGVLLVFAYLIVPAALASLVVKSLSARFIIAAVLGAALSAVGVALSWAADTPTGPTIVATLGAALALAAIVFGLRRMTWRAAAIACLVVGGAILLIPASEQPWLDAFAPTLFLDEADRSTRAELIESIAAGQAELAKLRARAEDVRWGRRTMPAAEAERLRQYLAGRSEIVAGEERVLIELNTTARSRQRRVFGFPLLLIGALGLLRAYRRRRASTAPPTT